MMYNDILVVALSSRRVLFVLSYIIALSCLVSSHILAVSCLKIYIIAWSYLILSCIVVALSFHHNAKHGNNYIILIGIEYDTRKYIAIV